MFFSTEEAKETISNFLQGTVSVNSQSWIDIISA